jgi:hypothetical protein
VGVKVSKMVFDQKGVGMANQGRAAGGTSWSYGHGFNGFDFFHMDALLNTSELA